MNDCLFCKIVRKEIPAKIAYEDDHVVAFHDLRPVAPTHVLVVPRGHVAGIHDAGAPDGETGPGANAAILGNLFMGVRAVADELGLDADGYRVVMNNGVNAGQTVFHLHVHVLGGRNFEWPPG